MTAFNTETYERSHRIMALAPGPCGTGYAVIETPLFPLDRGVNSCTGAPTTRVAVLTRLIEWYRPDVLILEDIESAGCRRRRRARDLIRELSKAAEARGVAVRPIDRLAVLEHFDEGRRPTKVEIAHAIGERLPELRQHVPPSRRLWRREAHSMPMFDAFAMIFAATKTE